MNSNQDPSAAKPPHIEDNEALVAKLRAGRAKAAADLAAQAKKQAAMHQRLNKASAAGMKK